MEGVALLIFVCLAGHQDDCRMASVAWGFVSDDACKAAVPLALGWMKLHPELELRSGTYPFCTTQANYLINRFKA